jgi:serine/threonine protein kinase
MPTVLGEGSYGCIHSPALTCKNQKSIRKKNYVSKSLIKSDGDIEKHHMNFIKKIDPNYDYHLKTEEECNLDNTRSNNQALDNCSIFKDQPKNDIRLLIMENGGLNLEDYSVIINTKEQALLFWLKIQKTIKAVKLYLDNDIIHNDLKAQNILFNEKTQKMAIIDFGLMHSKKKKENASKNYQLFKVREVFNLLENKETIFINEIHWSWPLENEYIEKTKFVEFIEKTPFSKHQRKVEELLINLETIYQSKNAKKINALLDNNKTLDTYYTIINEIILGTPYSIYDLFNDYLNNIYSIQQEYKNAKNKSKYYDEFLEIHLNTMDIYGLGIAFITSLKLQRTLLDTNLIKELYQLFYRMITPIIKNRIHINDLLETYESIMNKYIKQYNLAFINNMLIKIPTNQLIMQRSKKSKISRARPPVTRNKTKKII